MTAGLLFWVLFIIAVAVAIYFGFTGKLGVVEIFLLVETLLLGWQVFGPPIKRG